MAIEYPNLPEVEVLLDGKPLPRELWERHAVYVSDLHDAMSGTRAVVYGCAGTVTIRRRNAGVDSHGEVPTSPNDQQENGNE